MLGQKKIVKLLLVVLLLYVGVVVLFESSLGYFQPEAGNTVVITTFDEQGNAYQRVVSLLQSEGTEYVAVNHWPRAWYRRVRENGQIHKLQDGTETPHQGVIVSGEEYDRVQADNPTGFVFRLLTGFPPRYFIRLDVRQDEE